MFVSWSTLLQKEPLVSHAEVDMAQQQADRSAAGGPKRKNALFLIIDNTSSVKRPMNTTYCNYGLKSNSGKDDI